MLADSLSDKADGNLVKGKIKKKIISTKHGFKLSRCFYGRFPKKKCKKVKKKKYTEEVYKSIQKVYIVSIVYNNSTKKDTSVQKVR